MTSDDSDALLPRLPEPPAAPVISGLYPYDPISSPDSFQRVDLRATYSPDDRPFETFYLPLLSRAVTYDRAVGYWSAAELQYAAQGTAHFLANGGKMRLIVGAQLAQRDVDAVIEKAMAITDAPVVIDFVVGSDAQVWPMVAAGASNDDILAARDVRPVFGEGQV